MQVIQDRENKPELDEMPRAESAETTALVNARLARWTTVGVRAMALTGLAVLAINESGITRTTTTLD